MSTSSDMLCAGNGSSWKRHMDQLSSTEDDPVQVPSKSDGSLLLPEPYMPSYTCQNESSKIKAQLRAPQSMNEYQYFLQFQNHHRNVPQIYQLQRRLQLRYLPFYLVHVAELTLIQAAVFNDRSRGNIQTG